MKRALPLVILLVSAVAWAADGGAIFDRFDHPRHEKALARAGVSCVTCHPVGAAVRPTETAASSWILPPSSTCHECHAPGEGGLGGGKGQAGAPSACGTCHGELPFPGSHAAGWLDHHGLDAQTNAASCRDCHTRSSCVDCHDRRENTTSKVHDASWLTVHGIVARAGPAGCDSCHVQAECTSCHASTAGFGRSP